MKRITVLLTAAVMASFMLMSGCKNDNGEKDPSNGNSASEQSQSKAEKPLSGAKPVLSINNVQGRPGETVEVVVSVSGAEKQWASCGVHFYYDNSLECQTEDGKFAEYQLGNASKDLNAFTAAVWTDNLTDYMIDNNYYSLFFAAMCSSDSGKDGDIATFYFKIPEDAKVGTEYPLEFFSIDGDMFTNIATSDDIQEYAFSHWKNGSISVV